MPSFTVQIAETRNYEIVVSAPNAQLALKAAMNIAPSSSPPRTPQPRPSPRMTAVTGALPDQYSAPEPPK